MNTDPSLQEITVEIKSAEPADAADPGDNPTQDTQDTELKTTGPDSGDLDIKMD